MMGEELTPTPLQVWLRRVLFWLPPLVLTAVFGFQLVNAITEGKEAARHKENAARVACAGTIARMADELKNPPIDEPARRKLERQLTDCFAGGHIVDSVYELKAKDPIE